MHDFISCNFAFWYLFYLITALPPTKSGGNKSIQEELRRFLMKLNFKAEISSQHLGGFYFCPLLFLSCIHVSSRENAWFVCV